MQKLIEQKGTWRLRGVPARCGRRFWRAAGTVANRRGTSIVIALGLIAAILFFTIGIAGTVVTTLRNTSSSKKSLQAEYSAQSGIEMVKKELAGMETALQADKSGHIFIDDPVCKEGTQNGLCDPGVDGILDVVNNDLSTYVSYEITGQDSATGTKYSDESYSNWRSVPILGKGDAGDDCAGFEYRGMAPLKGDVDHPCNWNKLYYGKSVSVPLYVLYKGGYGEAFANPSRYYWWKLANPFYSTGLGMSGLEIRVRAPCAVEYVDGQCSDWVSVDAQGLMYVVADWRISGDCYAGGADGEPCALMQKSAYTAEEKEGLGEGWETVLQGSVIRVDRFSPPGAVAKVDLFSTGPYVYGQDLDGTLVKAYDVIKNDLWKFNKPVLKLSFVKALVDSDVDTIPYLEYQILYKSTKALASVYTALVEGWALGFKYSVSAAQSLDSGVFDFAVQN